TVGTGGNGNILVNSADTINAPGIGIYALQQDTGNTGNLTVVSSGPINASESGIFADSEGSGSVNVSTTAAGTISGSIYGSPFFGIFATSGYYNGVGSGPVTVIALGNIGSGGDPIYDTGISAEIYNPSSVSDINVTAGNVWANNSAIFARNDGAG